MQRWLKFCKFLPEFGWEPTVITVRNGSYPSVDPSLEQDVPVDLQVIKTSTREPFRIYNFLRGRKGKSVEVGMGSVKGNPGFLARTANYIRSNYFIPDARMGWNGYAIEAAKKVIERQRPDVIITTGPPHSTHLAGMKLHRQYQIPWVADFRDPWTNIYYNNLLSRTEASKQKDAKLENEVVRKSSALLTATPGLKAEFEDRTSQCWMIPNGFDEEDFGKRELEANSKFTLAYVGNLKPQQNAPTLWKALGELAQDPEFEKHFQLHLTGNVSDEVRSSIAEYGVDSLVNCTPFVPHKDSIKRMLSAHVLWLPVPQGVTSKHILTGKIFEYLATQRPILSMGPTDGNASEVLHNCGKDPMVEYTNGEGIKAILLKYYEAFKRDPSQQVMGNDAYKTYGRKGCTQQLANHLNSLVS